jgi:hypothetical protein
MNDPLFRLRPCIIAGESRPDDYSVVTLDGEVIGRIYKTGDARTEAWVWSITVNIPGAAANGRTLNLDDAKKAFRAAWDARPE